MSFPAARRRLLPLLLALGIDTLGTGVFVPISLLFFTRVADLPLTMVGALTSVGALASLPVPLLAGWLADRYGPRPVVIAGQLLQGAGFAGYLIARDPGEVFAVIAVVAIGQRLFWSTFFTLVAALPVEAGDGRVRDRRYALVGMVQSAGFGAGALVAGAVLAFSSTSGYLALAAVNAASYLIAAAAILTVPTRDAEPTTSGQGVDATVEQNPGATGRTGYRALLGDRPYLALVGANAAFAIASIFLAIALPVYLIDALEVPGWVVAAILAGNTVVLATGQLAAARAVRRIPRTRALAIAGAAWTAWALLAAAATQVPTPAVGLHLGAITLLYAGAELIHAPVSNALAAEAAPARSRGSYLALFQYGFTIATIVTPAGFTALFTLDVRAPWLALAALTATAAVITAALGRHLPAHAVHPGRST